MVNPVRQVQLNEPIEFWQFWWHWWCPEHSSMSPQEVKFKFRKPDGQLHLNDPCVFLHFEILSQGSSSLHSSISEHPLTQNPLNQGCEDFNSHTQTKNKHFFQRSLSYKSYITRMPIQWASKIGAHRRNQLTWLAARAKTILSLFSKIESDSQSSKRIPSSSTNSWSTLNGFSIDIHFVQK